MYIHVIISNGFHIAIDVATTQGTEGASCAPCPRTSWRTAQRSPRKRLRMEGNELRTTRRLRKFWKNNIGITWYNNNCYNHRYNCYSRRTVVITTVLQQLQSNFHQTTSDSRAWWTKPTDQWGAPDVHSWINLLAVKPKVLGSVEATSIQKRGALQYTMPRSARWSIAA